MIYKHSLIILIVLFFGIFFYIKKNEVSTDKFIPFEINFRMNENLPEGVDVQTIDLIIEKNSKIIFEQKITKCKKSIKICVDLSISEVYTSRYLLEDYGSTILKPNLQARKFEKNKNNYYVKISYKTTDKIFIRAINKVKSKNKFDIAGYINLALKAGKEAKKQEVKLFLHKDGPFLYSFIVY